MPFLLRYAVRAAETFDELEAGGPATQAKFRKVGKALALLRTDPRYPGLHSHQYENFPGHDDKKVWDSYVENNTPGAWRIYWMYGPNERGDVAGEEIPVITVLRIGAHP